MTYEQIANEIYEHICVCEDCPCFVEGEECNYDLSCREIIKQKLESEVTENDYSSRS